MSSSDVYAKLGEFAKSESKVHLRMIWREDIANLCTLEIDSEGKAFEAIQPLATECDGIEAKTVGVACETCLLRSY